MEKVKEWRALDHCDDNVQEDNAKVDQEADQVNKTKQESHEWIIIKDSEGVNVTSTDTQAAVNLQAGIQAAIAVVLELTIADSNRTESVMQDFSQIFKTRQSNRQKTIVEGSRQVNITTTDTDVAINIQLLLQILITIVVNIDVL